MNQNDGYHNMLNDLVINLFNTGNSDNPRFMMIERNFEMNVQRTGSNTEEGDFLANNFAALVRLLVGGERDGQFVGIPHQHLLRNTRVPTHATYINQLDKIKYEPSAFKNEVYGHNPECPVCLSEYEPNEIYVHLPNCKHHFHFECLLPWLQREHECPTCRDTLPTRETIDEPPMLLPGQPDGSIPLPRDNQFHDDTTIVDELLEETIQEISSEPAAIPEIKHPRLE